MQLGAFYPLSRNHRDHYNPDPDYEFPEKFINSSRKALQQRYNLMRYMYTRLYEIHTNVSKTRVE